MEYEKFPGLKGFDGNTSPTRLRSDDVIFKEFPDLMTGCEKVFAVALLFCVQFCVSFERVS